MLTKAFATLCTGIFVKICHVYGSHWPFIRLDIIVCGLSDENSFESKKKIEREFLQLFILSVSSTRHCAWARSLYNCTATSLTTLLNILPDGVIGKLFTK